MSDFDTPANELETAIEGVSRAPDGDPEGSARREVLGAFAMATLTVVLRPNPGEPGNGNRDLFPVHVSDGPDTEQPMLAVFSNQERARDFLESESMQEVAAGCELREVAGPQAVLAAVRGAGLIVNPNQPLGFRMRPELVDALRDDVASAVGQMQQEHNDGG